MAVQGVGVVKSIGLAMVFGLFSFAANAGGGGGTNPCSVSPSSNSPACVDIRNDIADLVKDYQQLANATTVQQELRILRDIQRDQADLARDIQSVNRDRDHDGDHDRDGHHDHDGDRDRDGHHDHDGDRADR